MTPGGLPQKGDRLEHKGTGHKFTVIKREGNDDLYSLILRPDDPSAVENTSHTAYGYPGCFRLLEAKFWLDNGVYAVIHDISDPYRFAK